MRFGGNERVIVNGKEYPVVVKYLNKRSGSATVRDGVIVIRMPRWMNRSESARMLGNLVARMQKALEKHPERFQRQKPAFNDGHVVNVLGTEYVIRMNKDPERTRTTARVYGNEFRISLANSLSGNREEKAVETRIIKLMERVSIPSVTKRINELNAQSLNSKVSKVRIKNLVSRWGSYSPKTGTLMLNVKLLTAPAHVMDYVIVHELCHYYIRNHGKRFWKMVEINMPSYAESRRWLRSKGDMLTAGGATGNGDNAPNSLPSEIKTSQTGMS